MSNSLTSRRPCAGRIVSIVRRELATSTPLRAKCVQTTSTLMIERSGGVGSEETPVSLGYDRIRFLAPVFIGDTITVTYRIAEVDPARRRSRSEIEVANQDGTLVAVGQHILKWVPNPTTVPPDPPSE